MNTETPNVVNTFYRVMKQECVALQTVCDRLSSQSSAIDHACRIIHKCANDSSQRVVVSGVGKAGLIARKVAATMSSTGTAATFLHPVEGLHGDMGFVRPNDAAIVFTYSGETPEIIRLAMQFQELECQCIAVTKSRTSSVSRIASAVIEIGDIEEACSLGLAPSSSTTVMLAIGDAIALTVAQLNGFRERDFAKNHPAGTLGLKYRLVESSMRNDDRLAIVPLEMPLQEVVVRVSNAKTGAAILTNSDGSLYGIFTDGDLRRAFLKGGNVLEGEVQEFASHPCHSISSDSNLAEAITIFSETRTEDLPVIDPIDGRIVGLLCLKDISIF